MKPFSKQSCKTALSNQPELENEHAALITPPCFTDTIVAGRVCGLGSRPAIHAQPNLPGDGYKFYTFRWSKTIPSSFESSFRPSKRTIQFV